MLNLLQGTQVESAIRRYGNMDVRWSSQGMLRLMPDAMRQLFHPTMEQIKQAVADVLNKPNITGAYSSRLNGVTVSWLVYIAGDGL